MCAARAHSTPLRSLAIIPGRWGVERGEAGGVCEQSLRNTNCFVIESLLPPPLSLSLSLSLWYGVIGVCVCEGCSDCVVWDVVWCVTSCFEKGWAAVGKLLVLCEWVSASAVKLLCPKVNKNGWWYLKNYR